ncbi:MAG: hypothetical protein WCL11_11505 [Verrucomicrobiota bacterium]
MGFWIIASIVILAGGLLVGSKIARARKRRRYLRLQGRTATWESIKSQPQRFAKIIRIDFGYGREAWAVPTAQVAIDRSLRAFASGLVVVPRPKLSHLQTFCQAQNIPLELMMVK